ncbi:MAG: exo-beta-N-acetylmuramidase NamZ family protein, partial [Gemmatimonadales bacterium]
EVLLSDSIALVTGTRVGLVSNQGGVDAAGVHDVERLRAAGINLVALFSPEHGFRGTAPPGESVASTTDSATGLPIYSLYGRTASPTAEMLNGLDAILIDLPDVGARYFTYLGTTINVMREAARHDIHVIVLDRPNPIGGAVQGNVLDTAFRSFVGSLAVPMRHGLTLGELALLARSDLHLSTELTVVPVQGWERSEALDETGLPFIRPSPNLATLESLFHYPGLCLFEGTNLSVGRGSNAPFEQIGSPWLDTASVLSDMREANIPGVAFESVTFTPHAPGDGKYADTLLAGIRLGVTDRETYDPTVTAIHLLAAVIARHGENAPGGRRFEWLPSFTRLAGTDELQRSLESGASPAEATAGWDAARRQFLERSEDVLLYLR